jgi:excisionase family DNA binding protein
MKPLLSIQQVADLLGVTRPTVYQYMRAEPVPLPVFGRVGGRLRFREEDVLSWEQREGRRDENRARARRSPKRRVRTRRRPVRS